MMRYTRTQHRPASRHVNDHGRVSGTHTTTELHVAWAFGAPCVAHWALRVPALS